MGCFVCRARPSSSKLVTVLLNERGGIVRVRREAGLPTPSVGPSAARCLRHFFGRSLERRGIVVVSIKIHASALRVTFVKRFTLS